jgi:tripartite-type tricarboxylate transporter receptor subunit TctC
MRRLIRTLFVCALFGIAAGAGAQGWPTRPVTLVVSTPSGTSPDRIGRMVADRLSKDLGQSFLVENQAGGAGLIAPRNVARARPDGYTLLFAGVDTLVTNPATVKDLGYDPERDFDIVSMIYKEGSLSIAVYPGLPVKTLPELIALAKKQPGKLSYGTTSVNFVILFGRWLNKLAGMDMVGVAYKSQGQQFTDVMEGRTQVIISSPPTIDPHMKAGKLRVLAVDGSKGFPLWPEVPTIAQTFPGWRLSGTGVLLTPKGTPAEVIATLHRAMEKIVTDKGYQQTLLQMGFIVEEAGTPESIRQMLRERREYWQQVFTGLGVKPE